jgi:molybdenum cofactor cytidylyltransferase
MKIGIVILAAGSSSRMGQPKQQLEVNGQPLLVHVVEQALSTAATDIIVVLGSSAVEHATLLEKYDVGITINTHWERGIGSSIKCALRQLMQIRPESDGILFMAGDQPFISHGYLTNMIQQYEASAKAIVASHYAGTLGIPVLFSCSEFDQILTLSDHHGAKSLLHDPSKILVLECPEGEIDIDTPDDYREFKTGTKYAIPQSKDKKKPS